VKSLLAIVILGVCALCAHAQAEDKVVIGYFESILSKELDAKQMFRVLEEFEGDLPDVIEIRFPLRLHAEEDDLIVAKLGTRWVFVLKNLSPGVYEYIKALHINIGRPTIKSASPPNSTG